MVRKFDSNNVEDILPLSPMQNGMLIYYLKNQDSEVYFENLIFDITGYIDEKSLIDTFRLIIKNNQILRSEIVWENIETPIQIILKNHEGNIEIYHKNSTDQKVKFEDINLNVDLRKVPFKIVLFEYDTNKYKLAICSHHILYDGWSTAIILKEFITTYHKMIQNENIVFDKKGRYKDYLQCINNQDKHSEQEYWRCLYQGFDFDTIQYFGQKENRTNKKDIQNDSFKVHNEKEIYNFINKNEITLAAYIYTAWAILIHKYTRLNDIVFGTTVSGRTVPVKKIENIVGLFINTIPLRKLIVEEDNILDTLLDTKKLLADRENYETTSIIDMKSYCNCNKELYDSIVVIENYPLNQLTMMQESIFDIKPEEQNVKGEFDLIVNVSVIEELLFTISYNKNCFSNECIHEIIDYFKRILENMPNEECQKIKDIKIIDDNFEDIIIDDFDFG